MENYLNQILRQLAARRKALRAARDNPALMPGYWAIVRSIGSNLYIHMRNTVIGGCTFPDRPIRLSLEDTAFLNFGTTAELLLQDAAWIEAEFANRTPDDPAAPSPESAALIRTKLAALARLFGEDQSLTRVYNFAAWLQSLYRDRLDVDTAQDLQFRIDVLDRQADAVPAALAAAGLTGEPFRCVIDAFNLFRTITGSAHQLAREKMSFVDKRTYVDTLQRIEKAMKQADGVMGASAAGRSIVREQFEIWQDANYEILKLTRQLRALWAGTRLDERIQDISEIFNAIQKTINRCSEEARKSQPQLPVFRADAPVGAMLNRAEIIDEFHSLMLHDLIAEEWPSQVRELRRFGPLAVVIAPGNGEPRYSGEVRAVAAVEKGGKTPRRFRERDTAVDHRLRYPLNCLVVPAEARRTYFRRNLADAWLEFNLKAFPSTFRQFLEAIKSSVPGVFLPPPGNAGGAASSLRVRRRLSKLIAAFVGWSRNGDLPSGEDLPEFHPFQSLMLRRLDAQAYVLPVPYRPAVQLFSQAGPKRRAALWKRVLGARFPLDQQLTAAYVLLRDWEGLRDSLALLPSGLTHGNATLASGFTKAADIHDPFAHDKAAAIFRKFMDADPELKAALALVENRMIAEVERARGQAENLGDGFNFEKEAVAILQRLISEIQERRLEANRHIDHYLAGLMYAHSDSLEAAAGTLVACLAPGLGWKGRVAGADVPDEVDGDWFAHHLPSYMGAFPPQPVPGVNAPGAVCGEYIYYNLGIVYMKLKRHVEAAMCFQETLAFEPPDRAHLVRVWAAEQYETAVKKLEDERFRRLSAPKESAHE